MPPVLLDTNVLVHAAYRGAPLHGNAARLVDRGLRERGRYCISPQNLVEFAAVVTRERLVVSAMTPEDLRRMTETLYESRLLAKVYPKRGTVRRALRDGATLGLSGPRWHDLYLAATMRDAGIDTIITEDLETFRKFSFIRAVGIEEASQDEVAPS